MAAKQSVPKTSGRDSDTVGASSMTGTAPHSSFSSFSSGYADEWQDPWIITLESLDFSVDLDLEDIPVQSKYCFDTHKENRADGNDAMDSNHKDEYKESIDAMVQDMIRDDRCEIDRKYDAGKGNWMPSEENSDEFRPTLDDKYEAQGGNWMLSEMYPVLVTMEPASTLKHHSSSSEEEVELSQRELDVMLEFFETQNEGRNAICMSNSKLGEDFWQEIEEIINQMVPGHEQVPEIILDRDETEIKIADYDVVLGNTHTPTTGTALYRDVRGRFGKTKIDLTQLESLKEDLFVRVCKHRDLQEHVQGLQEAKGKDLIRFWFSKENTEKIQPKSITGYLPASKARKNRKRVAYGLATDQAIQEDIQSAPKVSRKRARSFKFEFLEGPFHEVVVKAREQCKTWVEEDKEKELFAQIFYNDLQSLVGWQNAVRAEEAAADKRREARIHSLHREQLEDSFIPLVNQLGNMMLEDYRQAQLEQKKNSTSSCGRRAKQRKSIGMRNPSSRKDRHAAAA